MYTKTLSIGSPSDSIAVLLLQSKATSGGDDENSEQSEEGSSEDEDDDGAHGRKNIRKIMKGKSVSKVTKKAEMAEKIRKDRIALRQKLYNECVIQVFWTVVGCNISFYIYGIHENALS